MKWEINQDRDQHRFEYDLRILGERGVCRHGEGVLMVLQMENKFVGRKDRRRWNKMTGRGGITMVIMTKGRVMITMGLMHGGMDKEQKTMVDVGVEEDQDQGSRRQGNQFQVTVIIVGINILSINIA